MARVIEFYVPDNFRRKAKWVSPERRGKILVFGVNPRTPPSGGGTADVHTNPALEMVVLS